MALSITPSGPLEYAALVVADGVTWFEKTMPPKVEDQHTDVPYTIKIGNRQDLLSFRQLGKSALHWVIMERNDMRLWPNDFVPGLEIRIPTFESIRSRGIADG
jgi:hypothetical protein